MLYIVIAFCTLLVQNLSAFKIFDDIMARQMGLHFLTGMLRFIPDSQSKTTALIWTFWLTTNFFLDMLECKDPLVKYDDMFQECADSFFDNAKLGFFFCGPCRFPPFGNIKHFQSLAVLQGHVLKWLAAVGILACLRLKHFVALTSALQLLSCEKGWLAKAQNYHWTAGRCQYF